MTGAHVEIGLSFRTLVPMSRAVGGRTCFTSCVMSWCRKSSTGNCTTLSVGPAMGSGHKHINVVSKRFDNIPYKWVGVV